MRSKFAAAWPASMSNEETGEALAKVEKSRRTLHGKGERRRQAGEQSFERIFANQLYIKVSGDIGWL